jgi:hypothetical protein
MDIEEFLDKEMQIETKEKLADDAVAIQLADEEKGDIDHYSELWSRISRLNYKWDDTLYTQLGKLGVEIRQKLAKLLAAVDSDKKTIRQLIQKASIEIDSNNFESATKLYSEIVDMRNNFPDFFIEDKRQLNTEIVRLYEKLHDRIDSKFVSDFNESVARIDSLTRDSFSNLKQGGVDAAKRLYLEAISSFNSLPKGFMSQKIAMGDKLLELYKYLSVQMEIASLQKILSAQNIDMNTYSASNTKLKELSSLINTKVEGPKPTTVLSSPPVPPVPQKQGFDTTAFSNRIIARKLDRAKENLRAGLYLQAKKDIQSVLTLDPDNAEAKQMAGSIPRGY